MKRIGLLSDTHGDIPERLFVFFEKCDEIWHAGDIGNDETLNKLAGDRMIRAVHGNIDGQDIRIKYPARLRFFCEGTDILMTHIGGYPGHYDRSVRDEIISRPPRLFICGHSHILKVIYDKKLEILTSILEQPAGKASIRCAQRFGLLSMDQISERWRYGRLRDEETERLRD